MTKSELVNIFIKNIENGDEICQEVLIKTCFESGFNCGLIDVFFKRGVVDLIDEILTEKMNYFNYTFEQKSKSFTKKVIDFSDVFLSENFDSNFGKAIAKFLIKRPDLLVVFCAKISNFVMKSCGDNSLDFTFYTKRGVLSYFFIKFFFNYAGKKSFDDCLALFEIDINSTKNIAKIKEKVSHFTSKFF